MYVNWRVLNLACHTKLKGHAFIPGMARVFDNNIYEYKVRGYGPRPVMTFVFTPTHHPSAVPPYLFGISPSSTTKGSIALRIAETPWPAIDMFAMSTEEHRHRQIRDTLISTLRNFSSRP
jgi:hypothetical protein